LDNFDAGGPESNGVKGLLFFLALCVTIRIAALFQNTAPQSLNFGHLSRLLLSGSSVCFPQPGWSVI
jgi:hypothetical protein